MLTQKKITDLQRLKKCSNYYQMNMEELYEKALKITKIRDGENGHDWVYQFLTDKKTDIEMLKKGLDLSLKTPPEIFFDFKKNSDDTTENFVK